MSYTILMADDDEDIINIMRLYIETIGYIFVSASNGREALHIFQQQHVDIMVVDIEMPIMNGYELVENVRSVSNIPILVLSVKGRDNDRIKGLNAGVDDYICKPFNPMEVVARITANLRRFYNLGGAKDSEVKNQVISHGDISLDISKMQLFVQGKNVLITPTEFRILSIMLQAPGQVFTKAQLYEKVNGEFYDTDENTIMVHISNLRLKLGDTGKRHRYISTIRGIGYRFETVV